MNKDFRTHLFKPQIMNEKVLEKIFDFFNKNEKPHKPTMDQIRRDRAELDNCGMKDGDRISPFGPGGSIRDEILRRQKEEESRRRETLKRMAGPNSPINNPEPQPQPSLEIPVRHNGPTSTFTTTPSYTINKQPTNNPTISITPVASQRVAASLSDKQPQFTSNRLEEIRKQLLKQKKGLTEMSQYTPYLFHSPLLEQSAIGWGGPPAYRPGNGMHTNYPLDGSTYPFKDRKKDDKTNKNQNLQNSNPNISGSRIDSQQGKLFKSSLPPLSSAAKNSPTSIPKFKAGGDNRRALNYLQSLINQSKNNKK